MPPGRTSMVTFRVFHSRGPHHCAMRSGSVYAAKTNSRGALNMHSTTSFPVSVSVVTVWVSGIEVLLFLGCCVRYLLRLNLLQIGVQPIESLFPEFAILLHPVGDRLERFWLQAARTPLRLAAASDEAGALEHLEVLGDRRKAHLEGRSPLCDRRLAAGEPGQDRPARRVGESGEGQAKGVCRLVFFL